MKKIMPIIFVGVMIPLAFSSKGKEVEKQKVEEVDSRTWQEVVDEELDQTIQPVEAKKKEIPKRAFPNENQLRMIGRLANGITEMKLRQKGWYECGTLYSDKEEIRTKALDYAYHIVKASYIMSDESFTLNIWGLAGVIENESGFDRCALGLYPRKHAYNLGILKRRKMCISHTEEEVLSALEDPRMQKKFKRTGVDLGVGQVLSRFYDRPKDYRSHMQVAYGTLQAGRIMRNRARWKGTDRPWLYWRSTSRTDWYDKKVVRNARKMGATRLEI
jgi:hypothetical protein